MSTTTLQVYGKDLLDYLSDDEIKELAVRFVERKYRGTLHVTNCFCHTVSADDHMLFVDVQEAEGEKKSEAVATLKSLSVGELAALAREAFGDQSSQPQSSETRRSEPIGSGFVKRVERIDEGSQPRAVFPVDSCLSESAIQKQISQADGFKN